MLQFGETWLLVYGVVAVQLSNGFQGIVETFPALKKS